MYGAVEFRHKRSLRAEQNATCYPVSKRDRRRNYLPEKKVLELELAGIVLQLEYCYYLFVFIFIMIWKIHLVIIQFNIVEESTYLTVMQSVNKNFRSASLFNLRHPEHNRFVNSSRHCNNGLI